MREQEGLRRNLPLVGLLLLGLYVSKNSDHRAQVKAGTQVIQ